MLERRASAAETTVERHIQHDVPLVIGHVDDLRVAAEARVVHQDVDVAHLLDGEIEHGLHFVFFGDVTEHRVRPLSCLGFDLVGGLA